MDPRIGEGAPGELAILDAREEGEFGVGHLFWAVPCPLSRREIRARALLPRLATRIVCVDGGGGSDLAARLAAWLTGIGATDVGVLAGRHGGVDGRGVCAVLRVNVPSKAFGEWVEHHDGVESVDAPALKAWLDEGRDMVVLTAARSRVPAHVDPLGDQRARRRAGLSVRRSGARPAHAGGGELRGADALDPVRRASRAPACPTRWWRCATARWVGTAGLRSARGRTERFAPGRRQCRSRGRAGARLCRGQRVGVDRAARFARFEEDPDRTCYVLDVRDPAEFAAGHRPRTAGPPRAGSWCRRRISGSGCAGRGSR